MKKKIMMLLVILLITGCNINKTKKISCTKNEIYTRYYVEHIIEPDKEIGDNPNEIGANITKTREYYLKKNGVGLKRVTETYKIEFVIETDLAKQKAYYESGCTNIDENYKTCKIEQNENTITITAELNLKSDDNKDLTKKITKEDIIASASEDGGSCKEE